MKITKSVGRKNRLMKGLFFVLLNCYLCINNNVIGQSSNTDSLKQELIKATADTSRATILCAIGDSYGIQPLDSIVYYYTQALGLIQDNTSIKGKKLQADIFLKMSFFRGRLGRNDEAVEYIKKALELFLELENKRGELICYTNLGVYYSKLERHEDVIFHSKKGVALGEQLKDTVLLARCTNTLGLAYSYIGIEDQALEALLRSMKLYEELDDPRNEASTYLNVSIIYSILKEWEKEKKYIYKALALYQETGNEHGEFLCYSALAGQHKVQKKFVKAIEAYQAILSKYDSTNVIVHTYIGDCYIDLDDFDAAKFYLEKAEQLLVEQPNLRHASMLNTVFSKYYARLAEEEQNTAYWKNVIEYSQNVMKIAKEAGSIQKQNEAAEYLKKAYFNIGEYKESVKYADLYIETKDSMYSKEKNKALVTTNIRFDTKEKELEIVQLNREKVFQEAESNRQRTIFYIVTAILVVVFIFFIIVYVLLMRNRKANATLITNNKLITKQKQMVDQQHAEKELLLKEIHHRVKNNLQIISSLLDLQSSKIEDDVALSAIEDGQSRVKSMALIHHKLYQHENIATINFKEYVGQLFEQIMVSLTSTPPNLVLDIKKTTVFDIDTAIPLGLILNELLTNACKYAFEEGKIGELSIKLREKEKGAYFLEVKDNGNGMPADFKLSKARSLGLRLVRRLSKQLLGKATYKNDNGAHFCIEFKDTALRKTID